MPVRPPAADPDEQALRELVAARDELDSLEASLVVALRARGYTWVELAAILGVTPQGAGKRHRSAVRDASRRNDREPFVPFADI